ncbi:hypothetical protein ELI30_09460 [Rhizobium leguminosarum]|uniref:hypothetical protein n=1 Tax=Rhizobium leguminosarum TaxID=384 RepID=UPI0010317F5D|nr:hypothetical protein [Rhizobium leguminosarum]TAV48511.1 hypothetical protein ELI32_09915 [Rhizobium leguminosarum]TAV58011.1 hypothetical protein ELI31_09445 [Rhizobium leguminosarum]TAV68952.1 hypothetical protein ELI30_09460 [Rhizobium leguminosarum]
MAKQLSAWDQHKLDQEQRMLEREVARIKAARDERAYEASLRRRIAIQPYAAPLLDKWRDIREKLWKCFD